MNKLILKTALITIAALAVTALAVFSMWILCSPQTMAACCEKTGNYSFAVTCADLRYKYTGDAGDLARCAEDGILSGKDKHVIKYCGMLVSDEKFDEVCAERDSSLSEGNFGKYRLSYKAYIYGHLAAAQYRSGDKTEAVQTAEKGGAQSFGKIVIEIAEAGDGQTAQSVIEVLGGFEQTEQVTNLINLLKKYV